MPTSFPTAPIEIDVVAYQDACGIWVGQCIQYDIAAHAKTFSGLLKAIERTVAANICINQKLGRKGLEGIPPAPEKFRKRLDQAEYPLSPLTKIDSAPKQVHIQKLAVLEPA